MLTASTGVRLLAVQWVVCSSMHSGCCPGVGKRMGATLTLSGAVGGLPRTATSRPRHRPQSPPPKHPEQSPSETRPPSSAPRRTADREQVPHGQHPEDADEREVIAKGIVVVEARGHRENGTAVVPSRSKRKPNRPGFLGTFTAVRPPLHPSSGLYEILQYTTTLRPRRKSCSYIVKTHALECSTRGGDKSLHKPRRRLLLTDIIGIVKRCTAVTSLSLSECVIRMIDPYA